MRDSSNSAKPTPPAAFPAPAAPHLMKARVAKYITEKGLVEDGDRLLAMVSGGADSTAMLWLLHSLSTKTGFLHSFSLGVCHVNYGRRGEASDGDEDFVLRLGERLGIPVHVTRAPRGRHANFQAWARDFRYLAAHNLCRERGYTRIAVAHNLDDRIETFLYRLLSYSGRRSLTVMPAGQGRVIRPLLFATAAEIRDLCDGAGIGYRVDESNLSQVYTRNRVRQQLMPRLAGIRPDFRQRIADTLDLLEDEEGVLAEVTEEAWELAAREDPAGTTLAVDEIAAMPAATGRLVLRRWLEGAGVKVRLSRRLLDAVARLCLRRQGTGTVSISGGLLVERRYGTLLLAPEEKDAAGAAQNLGASSGGRERSPLPPAELPVPGEAIFGDFLIEAVKPPPWELRSGDPWRTTIDAGRLTGPLRVRSWMPGDRFSPLGLGGSKSIQDLFTDAKVPRAGRRRIPIVTCGEKIVWVCGLRPAEEFKVTGATRERVGLRAVRRAIERAI